jgi:hypothetical protein
LVKTTFDQLHNQYSPTSGRDLQSFANNLTTSGFGTLGTNGTITEMVYLGNHKDFVHFGKRAAYIAFYANRTHSETLNIRIRQGLFSWRLIG